MKLKWAISRLFLFIISFNFMKIRNGLFKCYILNWLLYDIIFDMPGFALPTSQFFEFTIYILIVHKNFRNVEKIIFNNLLFSICLCVFDFDIHDNLRTDRPKCYNETPSEKHQKKLIFSSIDKNHIYFNFLVDTLGAVHKLRHTVREEGTSKICDRGVRRS